MPQLEKAKLQPVRADRNNTPAGDEVSVQFNPTSLRLTLTNRTEGGNARQRQRRQHTGTASTVLNMDLIFDTADETSGSDNPQPRSVREKTAVVEQFVVPKRDGSEVPPRLKFTWNELEIVGIVENVTIDFDFFASDGTPLRAKVALSIKEQEPKYQFLESGPGARNNADSRNPRQGDSSTQPGGGTNDDPGTNEGGASDRSAPALEGETAAGFAVRQGLSPAAWRGLDVDLSAGLTMEAGLQVGFKANLNVSAGIGISAGFQAGADLSLEAAAGLKVTAGASVGATGSIGKNTTAGFALSAVGGVGAAIETVKKVRSQTAAQKAVAAFSTGEPAETASARTIPSPGAAGGGDSIPITPVQSSQPRKPLIRIDDRTYQLQSRAPSDAPSAPQAPDADPRAVGYGFGVPLRPQIRTTLMALQPRVYTHRITQARRSEGMPQFRRNTSTSPWIQLPQKDPGRQIADAAQMAKVRHPCHVLYTHKRKGKKL